MSHCTHHEVLAGILAVPIAAVAGIGIGIADAGRAGAGKRPDGVAKLGDVPA